MKISLKAPRSLMMMLGVAIGVAHGCSGGEEPEEPVAAEGEETPAAEEEVADEVADEAEPAAEPVAAEPVAPAEPEGFTAPSVSRYVTSYALNVRTGPGKEFPVKRHVKWGDKIDVVINGEWAKLGTDEYVSINRLSETPPTKRAKK